MQSKLSLAYGSSSGKYPHPALGKDGALLVSVALAEL
jgi:hypothetical protein